MVPVENHLGRVFGQDGRGGEAQAGEASLHSNEGRCAPCRPARRDEKSGPRKKSSPRLKEELSSFISNLISGKRAGGE